MNIDHAINLDFSEGVNRVKLEIIEMIKVIDTLCVQIDDYDSRISNIINRLYIIKYILLNLENKNCRNDLVRLEMWGEIDEFYQQLFTVSELASDLRVKYLKLNLNDASKVLETVLQKFGVIFDFIEDFREKLLFP